MTKITKVEKLAFFLLAFNEGFTMSNLVTKLAIKEADNLSFPHITSSVAPTGMSKGIYIFLCYEYVYFTYELF